MHSCPNGCALLFFGSITNPAGKRLTIRERAELCITGSLLMSLIHLDNPDCCLDPLYPTRIIYISKNSSGDTMVLIPYKLW